MTRLGEFTGAHYGEAMVVCGLGNSINTFREPERFRTIGVNDIGRAFTPDYLFVMDSPQSFGPERFRYIRDSGASYIFTDHELGLHRRNVVRIFIRRNAAPKFDDPEALYMIGRPPTSPFLAICLAAHMGAKAIGLIGVDFSDGHFFAADGEHRLAKGLDAINHRFYQLGDALLERGVKIFNLSAESRLNAFPRLSVEFFYTLQQNAISRSWSRPARRVCLLSSSPPTPDLQEIARLINCRTMASCRLIAPGSPDIRRSSSPAIEKDVVSKATVKLDCATDRLPSVEALTGTSPHLWDRALRPLLPSGSFGIHKAPRSRTRSVCVIVSQGSATAEEVAETVHGLRGDLLHNDRLIVLGGGGSSIIPACLKHFRPLQYDEPLPQESCIASRKRLASKVDEDIIVFTDANIQAPSKWLDLLVSAFDDPSVAAAGPVIVDLYDRNFKGYGMTWTDAGLGTAWLPRRGEEPYSVPLLPGVFLAVRRSALERIGGIDAAMQGNMGDDLELCFRLWTCGFRCVVMPQLEVLWMNPFAAGAERSHQHWKDLLYNTLRLASVHFGVKRRAEFAAHMASDPLFPEALDRLARSDAVQRRRAFFAMRKYSDSWFFQKFPI